jgi:glycogen synthase
LPSLGGVEELTRHLALTLVGAGDDVEVWTTQSDGTSGPTTEQLDGIVVRRFPFPLPRARPGPLASSAVGATRTIGLLRRASKTFRPDVLHVQCFGPNGAYATALAELTGVPLVVTLQGETVMDDLDIFDHSTSLRFSLRRALRRAAAVTGCSAFTLRDAEARFGLATGRGQVIFNGVVLAGADSKTSAEPAAVGRTAWGRYVIALGRVVDKKGFDLLLRAFVPVAGRHPDVQLVIGGDGWALPALRDLAAELGVTHRVRFVGRLSREQVALAMREAEAFVMPSRLEPFGIVVLEAWRAEVAVICTSRGGPPEFVEDGRTGLLVDPYDTAALETALERVVVDPELRDALAVAGKRQVENFAWPRIADQYRRIYDELPPPGRRRGIARGD